MIFTGITKKLIIRNHKEHKHLLRSHHQPQMLGYILKGKFCGSQVHMQYLRGDDPSCISTVYGEEYMEDSVKYVKHVMPVGIYGTDECVDAHIKEHRTA